MKKRILVGLLVIIMCFGLIGCGKDNNSSLDDNNKQNDYSETNQESNSTTWPNSSIFPKPEGCIIEEVKQGTNGFYYITVKWNDLESAKTYIKVAKDAEGSNAEVIGQGETETSVYYGTYGITVSSINEPENIVLYK